MTDRTRVDIPPALEEALSQHSDGAELRALWSALPTAPATADDAALTQREAAWQRLSATMHDPARVPSPSVDASTPFAVVAFDANEQPSTAIRRVHAPLSTASTRTAIARRWRIAAALAVLIGGTAAWNAVPQEFALAAGAAPSTLSLADGSRVTLAPGAQLRMPRSFRAWYGGQHAQRTVRLTGEAFFDVAHDGRPFIVETRDALVRVLGTHFDVRSPSATVGTRVIVEEGRVSVRGRSAASPALTLSAGQAASVGSNGSPERLDARNVARATSWRTGGLAAVDEPLGDVLAELARRSGVEITLDRNVPADATVSLFYADAPAVERVLSDLSSARALHFTRTSRGYRVSAAPAAP